MMFDPEVLTDEQSYQLDVCGYLVIPGVLDAGAVARLRQLSDVAVAADRRHASFAEFLGWDQAFLDLIDHPRTLPIVIAMCGAGARLDSAVIYQTTRETPPLELHPRATEYGAFTDRRYQPHWRLPTVGGLTVQWALTDLPPGAGGLCCIPGSHRASGPLPEGLSVFTPHSLIRQVPHRAGDVIVFSEALCHGTLPYDRAEARRTVLLKYAPGNQIYFKHDELRDAVAGRTLSRSQRLLLEPPYIRPAPGKGPHRELLTDLGPIDLPG